MFVFHFQKDWMIHQRKPIGVFVLTTMINHYLLMFTFLVDWESQHLRMVSQFIMLFVQFYIS